MNKSEFIEKYSQKQNANFEEKLHESSGAQVNVIYFCYY